MHGHMWYNNQKEQAMPELIIESPTHGTHTVLYDEEDREIVESYKWHISKQGKGKTCYVQTVVIDPDKDELFINPNDKRKRKKRKTIHMHRLITKCPKHLVVDHINHNGLDNRKENLRICTHQQNQYNKKLFARNSSGFKGVSWSKRSKKWKAQITPNNKYLHLCFFNTKEEAARAYDANAHHYFGEFAFLNYPDEKIDESLIISEKEDNKKRNNTSGFHGVYWRKRENKWSARATLNKKRINVGYFKTAIEAAKARDKKIKELMGDSWKDQNRIKLNFPDE